MFIIVISKPMHGYLDYADVINVQGKKTSSFVKKNFD